MNRTKQKAEEIVRELSTSFPAVEVHLGYPAGRMDLVVNATSLGLQPDDPLPFSREHFDLASARAVYDMVYRPVETPFCDSPGSPA